MKLIGATALIWGFRWLVVISPSVGIVSPKINMRTAKTLQGDLILCLSFLGSDFCISSIAPTK
jgi:hypothetical protein